MERLRTSTGTYIVGCTLFWEPDSTYCVCVNFISAQSLITSVVHRGCALTSDSDAEHISETTVCRAIRGGLRRSLHTLRHHHRHPEQSNKDSLFTLYLAFFIFAKYKSTKRQFICGRAPTFNLCFRLSAASKWVFLLQDCTSMKTNFRFSASPPVLTCYYFHIIIVVRPITKCTGYIYPLLEPHDSFNRILVLLGVVVDAVYRREWIICDWPSFWRVRHFG